MRNKLLLRFRPPFDRDLEHQTSKHQHQDFHLRFYKNTLAGKGNAVHSVVEDVKDLPVDLHKAPEIGDAVKSKKVHMFRFKLGKPH